MDENRLIVVASLMHNIGKFMQRGEARKAQDYAELSALFFDSEKSSIFYSETAEFMSALQFLVKYSRKDKLDGLKDTSRERVLAEIIAEAESIAGEEGDSDKVTLLQSIFPEIHLPERAEKTDHNYFYRLNPLSFSKRESIIYPINEYVTLDEEYRRHWSLFLNEFKNVLRNESGKLKPDTLFFLLEKYLWCVPSHFKSITDISFFEHAKVTAAVASSMYRFIAKRHGEIFQKNDAEIIKDITRNRNEKRYLLAVIDINGIQKFIYSITSKKGLQSLKGRSFYIEVLSNMISHRILWDKEINLYETNIIYTGGGKTYFLLPLTAKEALFRIKEETEQFLFEKFDGNIMVTMGIKEASADDLSRDKIDKTWSDVLRSASQDRTQKFRSFIEKNYSAFFAPKESGGYFNENGTGTKRVICQICGKEIPNDEAVHLPENEEELKICKECKKLIDLGRSISKAHFAVISEEGLSGIFNDAVKIGCKTLFFSLLDVPSQDVRGRSIVFNADDTNLDLPDFPQDIDRGYTLIAGGKPSEKVQQIDDLVDTSTGIKRLGILRMDVDNLGKIFGKGLQGKMHKNTLTRLSQLSSSISIFFKGELNNIVEEFRDHIYVIYAGGDDMFVIGSWDKIPAFAIKTREGFKAYTCNNPSLSISGGISLIKSKYPLSKGAVYAGEAEEEAKSYEDHKKDAISFLSNTVSWNDFFIGREMKNTIRNYVISKGGEKSLIRKMQRISTLYKKKKEYYAGNNRLTEDQIARKARWSRWIWMLAYYIGRNSNPALNRLSDILLKDEIDINGKRLKSDKEVITYLSLPVTWADYLTRQKEI